jgi:hypothetical protein
VVQPSFVLSDSGYLVDEPARLAQFVVELRRGELVGSPLVVVERRCPVLAIATLSSLDELRVGGRKARLPGFKRAQAGR